MNRTEEGRLHFDLVLSGKPLEVSSGSRKGKYSLEVIFEFYFILDKLADFSVNSLLY